MKVIGLERFIVVIILFVVILICIILVGAWIIVGFFDDLFHFNMEQTLSRSLVFIFPNGIKLVFGHLFVREPNAAVLEFRNVGANKIIAPAWKAIDVDLGNLAISVGGCSNLLATALNVHQVLEGGCEGNCSIVVKLCVHTDSFGLCVFLSDTVNIYSRVYGVNTFFSGFSGFGRNFPTVSRW